jgi:rhodanese-related sulfurtransferase
MDRKKNRITLIRSVLLPAVVLSTTLLVLWSINRPVQVIESSYEQVQQEAERGGYRLLDAESLWKLYETTPKNILLIDTRQEWEHRAGHIEGSLNFSMEPTWRDRWQKERSLERFLGPDKDPILVFY